MDWNGAFAATYSSPDLIEEVQISVGTVDAAAGRGSSQVRLQTRSGTNEFHGALFYGTNNSALNANSWFDNLDGIEKDWTNRQQYGGRIGGPIVRNKAFFFVLIDNQEYRARQNVNAGVLTPLARQGIFRYFPGTQNNDAGALAGQRSVDEAGNPLDFTQIDGATGPMRSLCLFPSLPASSCTEYVNSPNRGTGISNNPFIQETLSRMPTPNNFRTGDGLNSAGFDWVRTISGIDDAAGTSQNTNRQQFNLRLDYQITDNNKVSWVMSRESNTNSNSNPNWPTGFPGVATRTPRIYTAQWTSSVTPTVLNEFRFGFRSTNWHGRQAANDGCCFGSDQFENLTDEAQTLFDTYYAQSNGYPYIPDYSGGVSNGWMPGIGGMRSQNSPLYAFSDNVSWIAGSHSFTAGWEGNWADSDGWNTFVNGFEMIPGVSIGNGAFPLNLQANIPGLDQNAGLAESILNDLAGSVQGWDHAYVVNDPSVGFEDFSTTPKKSVNYHQNDWAAFFKDDWNVTQNLTLNYGARWDVYGIPYEAKGLATAAKDGNFAGISGPAGALTEIIAVGRNSPNPNLNLIEKDWNNVAPSLGFSYRLPWTDRTTVFRGGYGISYTGQPTFLQYDFGPAVNIGATAFGQILNPSTYTALPGSTNPAANLVSFPVTPNITVPFETPQLDTSQRNANTLFVYADDRRVPYIQNMNVSIETEIAPNTNLSVAWIGTTGVSLWGGRQLNEPDIFASAGGESFLDAFIATREGGDSALFADMFEGLNFGSGVIGTDVSASSALRQWVQTDDFFADGEVAGLAEFVTDTNLGSGGLGFGGLLRANGYPENFLKLNPQFNQVHYYDNGDNSTYHSMQVQLTKRTSNGFSGQFSYTWSKNLSNGGTEAFNAREDQSFGTRDPNNRRLQKGVVGFHRSHAFNAHGVWSLPFGPGRLIGSNAPSVVSRLIEGWQLSTIFSYATGTPLTISANAGGFGASPLQTLAGESVINTPDLIGGVDAFPKSTGNLVVGDGVVTYLDGFTREVEPVLDYYGSNPDNLQAHDNLWQIVDAGGNVVLRSPKPGTTGNLSTGWLEGPGSLGLDMAMSKSVQITEGMDFTLRMDAINMLNNPQFGDPNTNMYSNNFGRITGAGGARQFTLNARIDF
jgi:hypothetical protein